MWSKTRHKKYRHMNVCVAPGSRAERTHRERVRVARAAARPEELAPGLPSSPDHDLVYRGGQIIPDLTFTNFYVGGQDSWDANDIQSIDNALAAAMTDQNLNNVMVQYFQVQGRDAITSTFRPSNILPGSAPKSVSQGDVENLVRSLHDQGTLDGFDFPSTVFNFLLPRGTILTTDADPSSPSTSAQGSDLPASGVRANHPIPVEDEDSSLQGLGGYHGSVDLEDGNGGNLRIYYAVGVYSETRDDGTANGIPVFDQPWKNVVATFYHELNEARTDPDVEEANKANNDSLVGWTSNQGEECGDFPVFEAGDSGDLRKVFQEVALTDRSRTVPIQFQYSNAVHGPEGPTPKLEVFAQR